MKSPNIYLPMSPEEIVQENLEAYNDRNIEGFMSSFAESIELVSFAHGEVTAKGKPQVRNMYQGLFDASPDLHSRIIKRIVFDNKVIDHESITGRMGSKDLIEMVLIYEVEEEKIAKITAIKK